MIRDAVLSDAEFMCAAERAIVARHEGLLVSRAEELVPSAFRERITAHLAGSAKVLVAEVAGTSVGHASLRPMSLQNISHVLRLDMCVYLGHWHQGYGRALLESLLSWARLNPNARKVELLVRETNESAVGLYAKCGFELEGRLKNRVRLSSGRFIDDLSFGLLLGERGT